MASPSTSPQRFTNPNPSCNSESIVTFTSRPLQKLSHQKLHSERAKRRRQQAIRMYREKQIPALTLHCVSQLSSKSCCKDNLHSSLEGEGLYQNDFGRLPQSFVCQEALLSSQNTRRGGGLTLHDGKLLKNRALQNVHSFGDCSGGDGDVSDVSSKRGLDLFELCNWQNGFSSSPSSNDELPLNVTRAVSECSDGGNTKVNDNDNDVESCGIEDDFSTVYWKLLADVLAAECNLLRVEKELALRRWNRGYRRSDATEPMLQEGKKKDDALETASCLSRSLRKRAPVEDPSEALQQRLQQSPVSEQRSHMCSSPYRRYLDVLDKVDMLGVSARTIATGENMLSNSLFAEMYTWRKQGFTSMELSETKVAAAVLRRESRTMPSDESELLSGRNSDQMQGEETYCKEAIQQIVAQVQAESEQWSQIQDILLSLQEEMWVLIEARELWEERAHQAEAELLSLKEMVHDWRCRAVSAEEEVAILRSERQALKTKMHKMKQKYAAERRRWNEAGCRRNKGVPLPRPDNKPIIGVVCDIEDQPRHANVGTQEDYALCESIVHSRNESSQSSADLGTNSQRLFQKSIKKSLDFSNISNDGNTTKSRVRSHRFGDQILKIEPTRLDFCSKTSDVNNKARHRLSGPLPKAELTRLECVEPGNANEQKERKKVWLFMSKENHSKSGPIVSFSAEPYLQKGSPGQVLRAGQDYGEHVMLPKLKTSMPSAPTSTPSRLPFAEIFNSPASH